ncbi:hypothetical protein GDO78_002079 [Eleutherodactylus coqui]|uniref:Uncharacterized protein n=1 Tax=Eleutherodactylus coqui TaxID=57060 RepID=A0A8J6FX21_ELECQ|nr:hypothetical protein GDO78_002079 [Eleutherodactylus coqui]
MGPVTIICGWPLHYPLWVKISSMMFSWYTWHTMAQGMLNALMTSEMSCLIHLAPAIMPPSGSNNSHCLTTSTLVGCQPPSQHNA